MCTLTLTWCNPQPGTACNHVLTHLIPNLYFTDGVAALQSIWFVGDETLHKLADEYDSMKRHAAHNKHSHLYINSYYNVQFLHPKCWSNVRSVMAQILNALVNHMNRSDIKPHLPKYILNLMDKDLIADMKIFDYGVRETFQDILKWVLMNFANAIEVRKEDMHGKCPGSILQASEPCLVWIEMVRHPESSQNREIFSLCRKFNSILEEVVSCNRHSHVLKPFIECTSANFDAFGHLTMNGKQELWWDIDFQLREFDHYKTELKLFAKTASKNFRSNNVYDASKYKWNAKNN